MTTEPKAKKKRKPKAAPGATPAELLVLADNPATQRIAAAMRTGNLALVREVRAAEGR